MTVIPEFLRRGEVLAALEAASDLGFVLVPRDPTEEMQRSGNEAIDVEMHAYYVWQEMVAAAPQLSAVRESTKEK